MHVLVRPPLNPMLLKVPRLLRVLSVVRPPLNPILLKVPRSLRVLSVVRPPLNPMTTKSTTLNSSTFVGAGATRFRGTAEEYCSMAISEQVNECGSSEAILALCFV